MKDAWSSDEVRQAEEPLIAAGEPLMARAAYGLARVVLREVAGGAEFEHEQIVFQPELVVRDSTAG